MDIIETAQDKMNKTIAVLNRDLGSLRAGRAVGNYESRLI